MNGFGIPHKETMLFLTVIAAFAAFSGGCAGPNTPLGAVSWLLPPESKEPAEIQAHRGPAAITDFSPKIDFSPARQVLHASGPVELQVRDPFGSPDDFDLTVRYNGLDVTRTFLITADVTRDASGEIHIFVPKVTLSPEREHEIEFLYRSRTGATAYGTLKPPECLALRQSNVENTGTFRPSARLMEKIEKHAVASGMNPSFFTALVAQESGFNRTAVSWARAIGLTQITPLAEKDISRSFPRWPRYPRLNKMPAPIAKAMIVRGKVRANNEWRLDEEKSIRGGIHFAKELAERWSNPETLAYLKQTFADPELEHTRLVLASYNSGYSRVKSALGRKGENWLEHPDLREARRYVNRILSYCYHFSQSVPEPSQSADIGWENSIEGGS